MLAACEPTELPYWVTVSGRQSMTLRGIGTVEGILRIQPVIGDLA